MTNQTVSDNLFVRLIFGAIKGCLIGVLIGVISGAVGGSLYWMSSEVFYQEFYTHIDLIVLVSQRILITGIPLGVVIGTITGLHHAAFRKSNLKSSIWGIIACSATLLGLWLSGFSATQPELILQIVFNFEIALIGLATGWMTSKALVFKLNDEGRESRQRNVFIGSISGLSLIVMASYCYFNYMLYLFNIIS